MDEAEEMMKFRDACIEALDQGLSVEDLQSILKDAFDYYYEMEG